MVSFDRPYDIVTDGSGDFVGNELPLIMRAEELNLDVTYITSLDLHERGELVQQHKAFLSLGHDEYWSKTMFDRGEQARDAGVNLAFFGANAVYRQIRFEPSALGADRHMVNYRSTADPIRRTDPAETTVQFRDAPVNRPEASLIGQMYQCNPVRADGIVIEPDVVDLGRDRHDGRVARRDPRGLRVRPVHPRSGRSGQRRDRGALADLVPRPRRLLRRHLLHGAERRRGVRGRHELLGEQARAARVPRDRVQPDHRDRDEERAPRVRRRPGRHRRTRRSRTGSPSPAPAVRSRRLRYVEAGTTSTGMPLTAALFESGSKRSGGASRLLFTPACSRATAIRVPALS